MPGWNNPHHVRSFYLVAHHGGITAALPHMGYGIQQPALSAQMIGLERTVGTALFLRKPFALTPAGAQLYEITRAYYEQFDLALAAIRQGATPLLSIGGADIVCAEYLPTIIAELGAALPELRIAVHCGTYEDRISAVQRGTLDAAIVALRPTAPTGLDVQPLLRLPLALLAPASLRLNAGKLLQPEAQRLPLIIPAGTDAVCECFDRGLKERGLAWPPKMSVNSIGLIAWYVTAGHGVGLTVDLPKLVRHRGLRRIPLPGFEPVEIAAVWRSPATPRVAALLAALAHVAENDGAG